MPRKYPEEFCRRAISLVRRSGQSVSTTASNLRITDSCLYVLIKRDLP